MNVELFRNTGVAAAYAGAACLRRYHGHLKSVTKKGAIDLVTEADMASEVAIIDTLRAAFPDHAILSEEAGAVGQTSTFQWIIDPLDGTTNFVHGLGICGISIALSVAGSVVCGIVLNPFENELFTATAGGGAGLNGHPIRVSDTSSMADSLLVTGFPYNVSELLPEVLKRMGNCLSASMGVRRLGAAALDLCYVAAGRFEGFWEQHLKPWDTAAGMLIAAEAGATVTDMAGAPYHIQSPAIVATNGRIHKELLTALTIEENA
ncbi:MAG: inositol monophosphatase family protein [Pseudomonadota bacterium]